ncbi:hypothetical protein [Rubrobacter aplysinae]|uniref:hypothetical protein n=1 Tax=Rubrobacter aplysinae TaxID=909625 RepID=UPI00064BEF01|nr:hypothetical protein [Rubrobacter aplysinae]
MGESPDLPSGAHTGLSRTETGEPGAVAFGLSLDLLLLALLPLWLFLASFLPVMVSIWSGLLAAEFFYPAMVVTGFFCYAVVLPLGVYRSKLAGARRREIAANRMSRFAALITELYAASRRSPRLAADPRAAQAFRLYALAQREVDKRPRNPRQETRGMISRGATLAERALAEDPEAGPGTGPVL